MAKLIIIALMSFSSAAFAAGHSGGKARLKQQLSCESAVISSLGEGYIDLFARLKAVAEKYDILSLTTPDIVQRNMGISIPAFYAEMNSLAAKILERSRQVAELDVILSEIEDQVSLALQADAPRRNNLIPNKARMETRAFDEWEQASDMPMGPHAFNQAKKPSVEKQQTQQQQRLQPLHPQPPVDPHLYDVDPTMPWNWPPRAKP